MKCYRRPQVWIAGLLLACFTLTAAAPAAEAKGKESKRYKIHSVSVHRAHGPQRVHRGAWHRHRPSRVVEIRRSSELPALAGFLGGLLVGAVITQASSAHDYAAAPPAYDYYDPYCRVSFGSLEAYQDHLGRHRHPGVVRVIEVETGDCVHVYRFQRGAWEDWSDDWE